MRTKPPIPKVDIKHRFKWNGKYQFSITPSEISLVVIFFLSFSCQKLKIESKYVWTGINKVASKAPS